jgi:hypothetical protein
MQWQPKCLLLICSSSTVLTRVLACCRLLGVSKDADFEEVQDARNYLWEVSCWAHHVMHIMHVCAFWLSLLMHGRHASSVATALQAAHMLAWLCLLNLDVTGT